MCSSARGCKESDTTEQLTELRKNRNLEANADSGCIPSPPALLTGAAGTAGALASEDRGPRPEGKVVGCVTPPRSRPL